MNTQRDNIIALYRTDEFPGGRYLHPTLAECCSDGGTKSRFDDAVGLAALAIQKVLDAMNAAPSGTIKLDGAWITELPYQAIKARDIALRIAQECGVSPKTLYAEAAERCGHETPLVCETAVLHLISG